MHSSTNNLEQRMDTARDRLMLRLSTCWQKLCSSMKLAKCPNLGPTSGVEAYHSVVNHFAQKMYKFSYKGMISRILLAAMHYNENAGRVLKVTRQGKKCDSIVYRKYRNGGYSQRKVLVNCTYGICKWMSLGSDEPSQDTKACKELQRNYSATTSFFCHCQQTRKETSYCRKSFTFYEKEV